MAVDKRAKGGALRELTKPVDLSRTCEGLRQPKNCQKETEDGNCSDE